MRYLLIVLLVSLIFSCNLSTKKTEESSKALALGTPILVNTLNGAIEHHFLTFSGEEIL